MSLSRFARLGIAAAVIISLPLITWIVYLAGGIARAVSYLYVAPIMAAAMFLGDFWAIAVALAAGFATIPIPLDVRTGLQQNLLDIFPRFAVFYALAMLTARLASWWRTGTQDLSALLQASRELGASLRMEALLNLVARLAARTVGADACCILLQEGKERGLRVRAAYGAELADCERGLESLDSIALSGRAAGLGDLDPQSAQGAREHLNGFASVVVVPLMKGDQVLGALRLYSSDRKAFDAHAHRMLRGFAAQAALAIENARLYESLRSNYWETVRALTRAIEAKDPYTLGHSERTTEYALRLASFMGLSEDETERIRFGGILHDIGKIGVAEHILGQGSDLSFQDETLARLHPLIGKSIVEPVEFLRPAADIILYHHERFDGLGYPEELSGYNIPFLARLFAVANAYDNLTSDQPGRPSLPAELALTHLRAAAGREFDPDIVKAFAACMRDKAAPPPKPAPSPLDSAREPA
jgi:hypothetical protein